MASIETSSLSSSTSSLTTWSEGDEEEKKGFSWDQTKPNPFCIPHIVDNILQLLSVSDLKSSRLVNSQYNEIACRSLARKEVITFNKISHLPAYLLKMPVALSPNKNGSMQEQLPDTLVKEDNKSLMAHASYHFNFDPDSQDPTVYPILEKFFDAVGHQITELHYTTDLIPLNLHKRLPHMGDIWKNRVNSLEKLSLEIKWGCPPVLFEQENVILHSVKKLVLDMLVTEREAERAAVFLKQLLSATPNLEEISIPGSKKFFDDYINVVLGRIILSLELPRLSTLNFCLAYNPTQIGQMSVKNFPLKSLILDFAEVHHFSFLNQNSILERSLQTLFAHAAPTLKNLHLCFPFNPEHPLHTFTFPKPMKKLSYLALGRFYGSVSILDNLPAIKKLELWNVQFHDFKGDEDDEEDLLEEKRELFVVPQQYLSITTVIS